MNIARRRPPRPPMQSGTGAAVGLTIVALAAAAAGNALSARRAERRNPPKGQFLEVDGVRLHYLEKGEGPPVVLIHGNVVSAADFVPCGLFDLAASRYRVIAFDRPGMGYSQRPRGKTWTPAAQGELIRRACAALGIERPVVVGHSLGASVAMAMGLDHPAAISGLVLLGGYYYPTARMDTMMATVQAIPLLGDVLCHTISPLVGAAMMPALVKGMFAPNAVPPRFSQTFRTSMAVRPRQVRSAAQDGAMMAPAAAAAQDRYVNLRVPLALMAGAGDAVADAEAQSARLHKATPHSSLHIVPAVGHMVHYAVPDQVVQAIGALWEQAGRNPQRTLEQRIAV